MVLQNNYPISDRVRKLLEAIPKETSPYNFISKLNNYNFITNPDVEDILIELSKFLGFDVSKNTTVTSYIMELKGYSTITTPIKHSQIRKKILYHYKSQFINKKHIKNKGIRHLHREKRIEELYNILKNRNVALREYPNSEIIGMDIDTHNYFTKSKTSILQRRFLFDELCENIYNTIKKDIPIPIIFIETSKIHRGLHIYFKLENRHNKLLIQEQIKLYLEKQFPNIVVEYRSKTHALRLPFSADYQYRDVNTFKKQIKLNKTILSPFKNISDTLLKNNDILTHLKSLTDPMILPLFPEDKCNPFYRPSKLTDNSPISYIPPTEKFKIYDGNRVGGDKTQWRLVNWCIHNKKSLEEFVQLSIDCNVNSKDLSSWKYSKILKECSSMYNFAKKNFTPYDHYISINKTNIFHSNLTLVTAKEKKVIKSYLYKLKRILPNTKFKNRLLKESEICFSEFFGKIEYEILCPRKIFNNAKITSAKRKDLLKGYQFPTTYLNKLKEHYNIKGNIKTIFKLFRMYFLELVIHSNGKTTYIPSLSSSTQYDISSFLKVMVGIPIRTLSTTTKNKTERKMFLLPMFLEEKHIIMLSSLGYKGMIFTTLKEKFTYFNRNLGVLDDWLRIFEKKLLNRLRFAD